MVADHCDGVLHEPFKGLIHLGLKVLFSALFAHLSRDLLNDLEIVSPPKIDTRQMLAEAAFAKVTRRHRGFAPCVRQSVSHSMAVRLVEKFSAAYRP
jgi:hypothetical protein